MVKKRILGNILQIWNMSNSLPQLFDNQVSNLPVDYGMCSAMPIRDMVLFLASEYVS
jgi:hypothetical protein